jgi:malonyl-ACP decarboxylase
MAESRDLGPRPRVTGLGVVTGLGIGKAALRRGLYAAADVFAPLARDGRQPPASEPIFIGVEVPELPELPARLPARVRRTASLSARLAVAALAEAWDEAELGSLAPERIGLVIGGCNLQTRHLLAIQQAYAGDRLAFLRPHYGLEFLDTDLCGLCCEVFGVRGFAITVGAASASGAAAILQAAEAIASGRVDACIALGAAQDLSFFELQGLHAMEAMVAGPDALAAPGQACRPFDAEHRGFVFGEMSAAVVLRRVSPDGNDGPSYGTLSGWAQTADGERGPSPSLAGEVRAIRDALASAGLSAKDIAYVNTHGTGSLLGDDTEVAALIEAGLVGAHLNATKSIIGHGLAAAGAVEFVATMLQMQDGRLHPTRNLVRPIAPALAWVTKTTDVGPLRHALSLSLGFGGINVALAVTAPS